MLTFTSRSTTLSRSLRLSALPASLALAAGLAAAPAQATPVNLITNGSFENTTAYYNSASGTVGTELSNSNLPGWQLSACTTYCGFQFLAAPNYGTAGIYRQQVGNTLTFYNPPGVSPDGGNAIVSDASYLTEGISQNISGLTAGDTYSLSFYQASTQQTGYTGAETDQWGVSFGTSTNYTTQLSTAMNNPSQGSTGWVQDTMSFVANAANQLVFFYATSSAGAQPPFLLLDGVSLTDASTPASPVPEPATLALIGVGFAGVMFARRKRQATAI